MNMKPQKLILIPIVLVCFGFFSRAQAQEGDLGGGNTNEGARALSGLTTGGFNTGLGWFSLFSHSDAFFNTGVGSGALLFNDQTGNGLANGNTAVGQRALFNNIDAFFNTAVGSVALANNDSTGNALAINNTAVGVGALFSNTDGASNNAIGVFALVNNITGSFNVAMGDAALNNADSVFNTAVGFDAGQATITGFDNIYLGDTAGTFDLVGGAVPDESATIRIGSLFTNTACFIGGIATNVQVWNGVTVCQVTVNGFGQLGVDCVNPNNPGATPA